MRSLSKLICASATLLALTGFAPYRQQTAPKKHSATVSPTVPAAKAHASKSPVPPLKTPTAEQFKQAFPDDSRDILEKCDKLTLYSIKSSASPSDDGKPSPNSFHDYPIVGKLTVAPKQRAAVFAQLYNGIANCSGDMAGCFNPHHALRAVKGKRYVDIVICFYCMQMQIYTEKHKHDDYDLDGISSGPRLAFDKMLTDGKVKLSE